MTKNFKQKNGFTLIETLVAIFVFALIMTLISGFIIFSYRTYGYINEQARAVDEARRGIETMIRDARGAKPGENGAYPIERADDKQFIFYSDIDNDGKTERVRYFLGTVSAGNSTQECTISSQGGTCSVNFGGFLIGELKSAQIRISATGDFDNSSEYYAVSADGISLSNNICSTNCDHCSEDWQGATVYDVTSQASDGSIVFLADANNSVHKQCPEPSRIYAMKVKFELSWSEEVIGAGNELKKGIIEPMGDPAEYPLEQESINMVTSYIRNDPPIFKYYDENGEEILQLPTRLGNTKIMKVHLIINIDPNRSPNEFELESYVQLRNLKTE
jgi:prepilin-type N-terminal cleavage/methylation domain-containing protein